MVTNKKMTEKPKNATKSTKNNEKWEIVPSDGKLRINNEDSMSLCDIFPSKPPKHLVDGLWKGTASIAIGISLGITSLVTTPWIMAREQGFIGFCKGVGLGTASLIFLPTIGAAFCIYHLFYGIIMTPISITSRLQGKSYDNDENRWKYYSLEDDIATYLTDEEKNEDEDLKTGESPREKRTVKETGLYDLLGVETNATSNQIRKAFYIKARNCHPDKNQDNPDAHAQFQELGAAYQILQNPVARARYDAEGKAAAEQISGPTLDVGLVFTMLFGSDLLEPYIGTLSISNIVKLMAEAESGSSDTSTKENPLDNKYRKRQVLLAKNLRDKIQPYVDGECDAFKIKYRKEAAKLVKASFGMEILDCVGWAYINRANIHLSTMGLASRLDHTNTEIKQGFDLVLKTMQAANAVRKTVKLVEKYEKEHAVKVEEGLKNGQEIPPRETQTPEEMEQVYKMVPIMLKAAWCYNKCEIVDVARAAAKKCVNDTSVSKEIRDKRAEAIKILGEIFIETAKSEKEAKKAQGVSNDDPNNDVMILISKAFAQAMEKQNNTHNPQDNTQM
eukprot:GHVL01038510.1.p1 GENE.GHVL01038510.1~~GHVL01038510.1.p1  ORF type:complete len:560 (+),score=128.04 GHVL01038510.1:35-1714(+)